MELDLDKRYASKSRASMVSGFLSSRKFLLLVIAALVCVGIFYFMSVPMSIQYGVSSSRPESQTLKVVPVANSKPDSQPDRQPEPEAKQRRKDTVDNYGAVEYLNKYRNLFAKDDKPPKPPADPNNPDTITTWWEAAAMIDWYINSPLRYNCKKRVAMGNWHVCQDEPYTVKPPCLVYSFGINFDFSFDDAMVKLGCEVHSFDPSMNWTDFKRSDFAYFYNMGISAINSDAYVPRTDMYIKNKQVWKMRTLKSVIEMLGHQNRVIDVLKIDVESYEWDIIDNLMETDLFQFVRQFELEFHLFPDYPLPENYVHIYKIYTRLREMGFREYKVGPHPKSLKVDTFNNQGDSEFVNAYFERKAHWR